jgi:hypothetical protein
VSAPYHAFWAGVRVEQAERFLRDAEWEAEKGGLELDGGVIDSVADMAEQLFAIGNGAPVPPATTDPWCSELFARAAADYRERHPPLPARRRRRP